MIELTKTSVMNFENAIRGMRNPLQSYDKSDSFCCEDKQCEKCPHFYSKGRNYYCDIADSHLGWDKWDEYEGGRLYTLGENDLDLAKRLCKAGSDHRKFLRQILVSVDIKAPLYFFKEFDQYKVATVTNSTSTMHKIHAKEFTLDDFSCEHLFDDYSLESQLTYVSDDYADEETFSSNCFTSKELLRNTIDVLNHHRMMFLETKDKEYWWQMIQLLPSSYNQLRTCTLNYETLRNIYHARCHHKLDEWHRVCKWIETLPYAKELIVGE